MRPGFSGQIKKKPAKYQIQGTSFQCEPSCSVGMDGHEEANSRFPRFCESA